MTTPLNIRFDLDITLTALTALYGAFASISQSHLHLSSLSPKIIGVCALTRLLGWY